MRCREVSSGRSPLGLLAILSVCCGPSRLSEPASTTVAAVTPSGRDALSEVVAGPQRSEKERARDVYRHPVETLEFFGVRSDMTVVELWPGGGWYTAILAPLVRERGKLTVASGDPNGEPKAEPTEDGQAFLARRNRQPEVFDRITWVQVPATGDIVLGPPESADAVVTFRNLHTFLSD